MKKALFFSILIFFSFSIFAQLPVFYRIDSTINAEIAQHNIAGGVALIARNGKIVHHQAYGFANLDASVKMQENAIFRIASQTKAIVSVAVLQLVEKGKIHLEDPIQKYFPEFSSQKVYLKQADSLVLIDRARSITIRDLLTHQSGISSADEYPYLQKEFVKYGLSNNGFSQYPSLGAEIAQIAKMPLAHQPGARFSYGLSTNVLGGLIELITKQTLSNYLADNIFKPLGMEDTYFYLPKSKQNRLVEIYIKQDNRLIAADRSKMPVDYPLLNNATYFSAIGGLVSTTKDYFLFLNHLLNPTMSKSTFRVLQPATVEQLLTNQLGEKTFIFGGFPSLNQFGLGVGLTSIKGQSINKASVGSYFWGGAFNTAYMVDPKRNIITLFYFQRTPFVLPPLLSKLEKTTIEIIDQQ
ncbi:MAG: serine hydrolase domain-containing protein [Chitinophagia bacterium]